MDGVRARTRNLREERSEETRTRLLQATIDSLTELGYARTTTTEIADRAGVSRAAWIYHFPTKATLVSAAVEHLFDSRLRELPTFENADPDHPSAAVEVLARSFEGPLFLAWLELAVAARTDEDLRQRMAGVSLRFADAMTRAIRDRFPGIAANPIFASGDFALALMDGIFLTRIVYADEERFRRMVETLGRIAEFATGALATTKRRRRRG